MTKLLLYILIFSATLYLLSWLAKRAGSGGLSPAPGPGPFKPARGFRPKPNPREVWVQVYETASMDEGRSLQARLQEEEVDCVLYEQGKKDIHGNPLKGIGLAVPKTAMQHAQGIISRMLG